MEKDIFHVKGTHCQSCVSLIRMEIEENTRFDLKSKLRRVELTDPGQQQGEIELADLTEEEKQEAIRIIADLGYQVIG